MRALLLVLAGCGRIAFDPSGDAAGDGTLSGDTSSLGPCTEFDHYRGLLPYRRPVLAERSDGTLIGFRNGNTLEAMVWPATAVQALGVVQGNGHGAIVTDEGYLAMWLDTSTLSFQRLSGDGAPIAPSVPYPVTAPSAKLARRSDEIGVVWQVMGASPTFQRFDLRGENGSAPIAFDPGAPIYVEAVVAHSGGYSVAGYASGTGYLARIDPSGTVVQTQTFGPVPLMENIAMTAIGDDDIVVWENGVDALVLGFWRTGGEFTSTVLETGTASRVAAVGWTGDRIVVAFVRVDPPARMRLFLRWLDASGAKIAPDTMLIDTGTGTASGFANPSVVASPGRVTVSVALEQSPNLAQGQYTYRRCY